MYKIVMIFSLSIEEIVLLFPALILSLTVHEYAHARVALFFGDRTAQLNGRVTLNPLKHLELFGTLALLFAGFGWAKPVPVNTLNMRNPRLGDIMVSLAGPASNLIVAIISAVILRLISTFDTGEHDTSVLATVLLYLAVINAGLCIFNLLPLFPLDGHHILRELLPASQRVNYQVWQAKYGTIILLVLVFGPELLGKYAGRDVFDPISWIFDKATAFVFQIVG